MEGSNLDGEIEVADSEHVMVPISRLRDRGQGVKLARRLKPKKTNMLMRCPNCYQQRHRLRSSTARDQELIFSIPGHAMVVVLNPLLLGVLQIEYQNKKKSPMETNPIQMWTFLTAICIYCFLLDLRIHMPTRSGYSAKIMNHVLLLSATLSSASLISVFLPRLLLWFLVVIWICLPVILARHLLKSVLRRLL